MVDGQGLTPPETARSRAGEGQKLGIGIAVG